MSKINFYFNGKNYSIAKSALASAFTSLTSAFETFETITGLEFTSNGDGTCYVSGIGDCTDLDIVIPATSPDGDIVTSIGHAAFFGCESLTSVEIPDGVISIDSMAFNSCRSLTSINIPNSVTSIGYHAFLECTSLTNIDIPASVISIDTGAFDGCTSLTSVIFAEGSQLTSIDVHTFRDCRSLTNIEIPANVISIGDDAFFYCTSLASVTFAESSQLTSIGNYALCHCTSLTSIEIPDSVTSIGEGAFMYCSNLTSIAFAGTTAQWNNITKGNEWNLEIPATYVQCSDGQVYLAGESGGESGNESEGLSLFSNGDGTCRVSGIGRCTDVDVVIPETSPDGDNVTSIGESAFADCDRLSSVVIPDSVTSIGNDAFSRCSNLSTIVIPDSVTSIGNYAFSSCDSLTSITIPDSVTSIGDFAFGWCTNLTSIEFTGTIEQWSAITFGEEWNYDTLVTYIRCSDKLIDMDGNIFEEGLKLISNGDSTCYVGGIGTCTEVDVVIPEISSDGDSVTSIGNGAFMRHNSLNSVIIPDSVTRIGSAAFWQCNSLSYVKIGSGVTSIANQVFEGCTSLSNIEFIGTIEQWNAITKDENWNLNVPAAYIQCSDGQVSLV